MKFILDTTMVYVEDWILMLEFPTRTPSLFESLDTQSFWLCFYMCVFTLYYARVYMYMPGSHIAKRQAGKPRHKTYIKKKNPPGSWLLALGSWLLST